MTQEQINKILENHKLWLESDGLEGKRADLPWANLSNANLSHANLSGVNFRNADLSQANLRGANLSEADLCKANLSKADLGWVNFSKTNLLSADLRNANLFGANLRDANVKGANFTGANIEGAIGLPKMTHLESRNESTENNENPVDKLKNILKSRQEKYGDSEKCLSLISKYWSDLTGKEISKKDVCVMMAMMKIARLKTTKETGYDPDTLLDLAGYALLALEKE